MGWKKTTKQICFEISSAYLPNILAEKVLQEKKLQIFLNLKAVI